MHAVGPHSLGETHQAEEPTYKDTSPTFHIHVLDGKGLTWQLEILTEGRRVDYKLDTGAN